MLCELHPNFKKGKKETKKASQSHITFRHFETNMFKTHHINWPLCPLFQSVVSRPLCVSVRVVPRSQTGGSEGDGVHLFRSQAFTLAMAVAA